MKKSSSITALFLDIGGVLTINGGSSRITFAPFGVGD